ncbi:MAG: hypothetical protein ACK5LY_09610, partial [Lachnospirales bacterium]
MSSLSENYGLIKPLDTDYCNIEDFNKNTDIIDIELKKGSEGIEEVKVELGAIKTRVTTLENNLYNPNLLINSNFKVSELINQRGATSYTEVCYCVDMWSKTVGTIDLTGEYVKINSLSRLTTVIENYKELRGKTLTLSVNSRYTNEIGIYNARVIAVDNGVETG